MELKKKKKNSSGIQQKTLLSNAETRPLQKAEHANNIFNIQESPFFNDK